MNRKLMPIMLFSIEVVMYYFICLYFHMDMQLIVGSGTLYFLFMFIYGHYSLKTCLIWNEIKQLVKTSFCFFIALLVLVPKSYGYDRRIHLTIMVVAMFVISLLASRFLRIAFREVFARKTLVIGTGYEAARLGKISNNNRFALTTVRGYVDVNNTKDLFGFKQENIIKHSKVYNYDNLNEAIINNAIEQIIIALPEANQQVIDKIMSDIYGKVESVKYLPNVNGTMTFSSEVQDFDGQLLIATSNDTISILDKFFKRFVDILAGIVGVITLLPLMAYVKYKYVKSGDHDNIMFSQHRIGKNGKLIKIYKFRSMIPDAEKELERLMKENPEIKVEYLTNKKLKDDPRITPVGHFLRKTSLDEWPQFINVLKGEMSFIGPRPYLPREKSDMGQYYDSIIKLKPGVTGMWQANGRSDVEFSYRCKLDDYYYHNWSIWLDFTIMYKTVKSVVYGKGSL
ncbi:UDP-phosphate galactose phosphotransferase [Thomasclavelia cocleata]|uniref:UDP-glucose:undecaprenyl-phosphate glucose-1-phosphate transferase n=1 Tax=Thomasclavelia cocleata TaxID=69824 RepID=A0A1I0F9N6_9FIRM|nr:exopolysaccharide biosynthesis polyprenyl glycosylphosphotransferase [Thomasclavelia cocleata]MCR1960627.1 exopolysaccharide biosynthesis polyprenyl glycosylphosphotransferase [Thomasclavelia cocleata]NDO41318.1 exopolysaccharide biosynthesis polyprenyl glycosylphosphotransferase [Thomasclavelia cocleata]PJN80293.1 UDP-phosphate galactose phosphotransferase [Thomasclavelia cocleata]SET54530.1 undecaprenyl-phosphate galactose phosphotransferase [Thomasclavelia cocleata]GFI41082.1 UDP-glucose